MALRFQSPTLLSVAVQQRPLHDDPQRNRLIRKTIIESRLRYPTEPPGMTVRTPSPSRYRCEPSSPDPAQYPKTRILCPGSGLCGSAARWHRAVETAFRWVRQLGNVGLSGSVKAYRQRAGCTWRTRGASVAVRQCSLTTAPTRPALCPAMIRSVAGPGSTGDDATGRVVAR